MSISICQYTTQKVSSSRTHVGTIDVTFDGTRVFLTDEQAQDLIGKMAVAVATRMAEEVDCGHQQD